MIERLIRKLMTAEIIGMGLIVSAIWVFVYGVSSSLRNPDPTYFSVASLIAAGLCFGLAKINSKPIPASTGVVALGGAGVWIIGARLSIPLIHLIQQVFVIIPPVVSQFISQVVFAIQARFVSSDTIVEQLPVMSIDTSAITQAWLVIVDASSALALRFQNWFVGWQQHTNGSDVLVRNLIWLLLLWLIAAWMGWFAAKRKAIMALFPCMILLVLITDYSAQKAETICGMVVILLLLMGVWNYKSNAQQWEKHKVDYSESIIYDNTQAVIVLALTIGALAFITPSISWREIHDALHKPHPTKNEVANALGIQQQIAPPTKKANVQMPTLPQDHLLGGELSKSQKIVMTTRTGELPPLSTPSIPVVASRYYWRSVIYDDYVGTGWITSTFAAQHYAADTPLIPGLLNGYKPLHLDVQVAEPNGQLFWSGTLFSVDQPVTAEWRLKPSTDLFANQSALLESDMFATTTSATIYHAEAYIPNASVTELRAASITYPDEIRKLYLELPSTVPERVLNLAKQITVEATTPYDKAKAIETYLRKNYPYDTNVPKPPANQDVADYFLFDLKKGYCDYYATAMVVLARANGIPARFVSGYSPGEYDAQSAQYVIRELNAHSWVEVYFPNIGWIEFEPTSSIPEILRKEKDDVVTPISKTDPTISNLLLRFRLIKVSYIVLPILVILFGFLLYFTAIEKWRYSRLAPVIAIEKIYRLFYRAGRPLVGERTQAETSTEFTEKLISVLHGKQNTSRFKKFYTRIQNEILLLADTYQSALFRDVHTQKKDFMIAWRAWTSLRWRLWIASITSMDIKKKFASLPPYRFLTQLHSFIIQRNAELKP